MFLISVGAILWLSLPLVCANILPVAFGRGGTPIDFNRLAWDGQPLLGQGKTWEGLIGGILGAVMLTFSAVLVAIAFQRQELYELWGSNFTVFIGHAATLAAGALLGDMIKSFFKRRLGKDRGQSWPLIDQFDAVLGGFGLMALVDWPWFRQEFLSRWMAILFLLVVYYLVHRLISWAGFRLGLKTAPH